MRKSQKLAEFSKQKIDKNSRYSMQISATNSDFYDPSPIQKPRKNNEDQIFSLAKQNSVPISMLFYNFIIRKRSGRNKSR